MGVQEQRDARHGVPASASRRRQSAGAVQGHHDRRAADALQPGPHNLTSVTQCSLPMPPVSDSCAVVVTARLSFRTGRFPHRRRSFVKVVAACRMMARRRGSTSSTQTAAPFGSASSSSSGTAERQPGARSGGSSATAPRAALPGERRSRTTCTLWAELSRRWRSLCRSGGPDCCPQCPKCVAPTGTCNGQEQHGHHTVSHPTPRSLILAIS